MCWKWRYRFKLTLLTYRCKRPYYNRLTKLIQKPVQSSETRKHEIIHITGEQNSETIKRKKKCRNSSSTYDQPTYNNLTRKSAIANSNLKLTSLTIFQSADDRHKSNLIICQCKKLMETNEKKKHFPYIQFAKQNNFPTL